MGFGCLICHNRASLCLYYRPSQWDQNGEGTG